MNKLLLRSILFFLITAITLVNIKGYSSVTTDIVDVKQQIQNNITLNTPNSKAITPLVALALGGEIVTVALVFVGLTNAKYKKQHDRACPPKPAFINNEAQLMAGLDGK